MKACAAFVVPLVAASLSATWPSGTLAQVDAPQKSVQQPSYEELLQRVEERDAVIRDLLRRVEALERGSGPSEPPTAGPAASNEQVAEPQTAQPVTPPPALPEQDPNLRALERTLVEEGGLVLPPATYEIEPSATYTYGQSQGLEIVQQGGVNVVTAVARRSDAIDAAATFRAGLPRGFQAELVLPYAFRYQRTAIAGSEEDRHHAGLGDIEIGLSKQWLRERVGSPALVTGLNWKTTTGSTADDPNFPLVSLGTGFHAIQASVVGVKTQDPLAFFGALSYTFNLPGDRQNLKIDPGDAVGFRIGTVFAASPETSLRLSYEHDFLLHTRVDGHSVPGSDVAVGIVEIGAAIVLTPRILLNVGLGFGVTHDSPDVRLRVSLPIRQMSQGVAPSASAPPAVKELRSAATEQ